MTAAAVQPAVLAARRSRRRSRLSPYALMAPITIFYLAVLVVPFVLVVATSFRTYEGAFAVGGYTGLDNYHEFLTGPGQWDIIVRTLRLSALTTVICLAIGFPTAYITSQLGPRARSVVMMGLLAPLLTSIIARTFGWWTVLGPGTVGDWIGARLGRDTSLLFTETAILIGMVNVFLTFMVLPMLTSLQNIDPNLRRAARSFGQPWWGVLRHVDLPLALPGIIGGVVIVMSLSLSSFVTPVLLGGSRNEVVASEIYRIGTSYYNRPLSAAGSVLLALVAFVFVWINLRLGERNAAQRVGMV